jgi:hypothetical protein
MLQNYIYIHYMVQKKLIVMYRNYDFCKLFNVEVRQRWKRLQSSATETIANFLLSESFLACAFNYYSSFPTISCFRHRDA